MDSIDAYSAYMSIAAIGEIRKRIDKFSYSVCTASPGSNEKLRQVRGTDSRGDLRRFAQKGSPIPGKKELALWGEVIFQRFSSLGMGDNVGMDVQGIKRDLDFL